MILMAIVKNLLGNTINFTDSLGSSPADYDSGTGLYRFNTLTGSLYTLTLNAGAAGGTDYIAFEVGNAGAEDLTVTVKLNGSIDKTIVVPANTVRSYIGAAVGSDIASIEFTTAGGDLSIADIVLSPLWVDSYHPLVDFTASTLNSGLTLDLTNTTDLSASSRTYSQSSIEWQLIKGALTSTTPSYSPVFTAGTNYEIVALSVTTNLGVYTRLQSVVVDGSSQANASNSSYTPSYTPALVGRTLTLTDNTSAANYTAYDTTRIDFGTDLPEWATAGALAPSTINYTYSNVVDGNFPLRIATTGTNGKLAVYTQVETLPKVFGIQITPDVAGRSISVYPYIVLDGGGNLYNGETPTKVEFNYGDSGVWDQGINNNLYSSDPLELLNFYGIHQYATPGTYTVSYRLYTQERGNTPYVTTADVTIEDIQALGLQITLDGLTVNVTDTTTYYDGAAPYPFGAVAFGDRSWYIYDANGFAVSGVAGLGQSVTGETDNVASFTMPSSGDYRVVLYDTAYIDNAVPIHPTVDQFASVGTAIAATVPSFSVSATGGIVAFTDTTTHDPTVSITGYNWDFGDSTPDSIAINPTHQYAQSGTYTVTLTVLDSTGNPAMATSQPVVVTVPPTQPDNPNQYTLKGFVVYPELINNVHNQVAPVGELSGKGQTYASDRQIYQTANDPNKNSEIVAFYSSDDLHGKIEVPQVYGDLSVAVSNWIYQQATGGAFTGDSVAANTMISNYFSGQIQNLQLGEMIQSGVFWFPTWIEFHPTTQEGDVTQSTVHLWFSDASFTAQYNEYELRVIPPVTNLDDFFSSLNNIQTDQAQFDLTVLHSRVQNASAGQPYTLLRSFSYDYVYPSNSALRIPFYWTVIEYGVAGDNLDAIKAALVTYILANSTHTRDEWSQIFPDIFQVTEFILTPRWDQYAIPNLTLAPGIYSPVVNQTDTLNKALATAQGVGYTTSQVTNRLNVVPLQYKSMVLIAVGGPLNKREQATFQQVFPDYINVPSSSQDNNRMSVRTQQFINLMNNMLSTAETMTDFSTLPADLMRVYRGGIMYVLGTFQSIQYLMVSRQSMFSLFGGHVVGNIDQIPNV